MNHHPSVGNVTPRSCFTEYEFFIILEHKCPIVRNGGTHHLHDGIGDGILALEIEYALHGLGSDPTAILRWCGIGVICFVGDHIGGQECSIPLPILVTDSAQQIAVGTQYVIFHESKGGGFGEGRRSGEFGGGVEIGKGAKGGQLEGAKYTPVVACRLRSHIGR